MLARTAARSRTRSRAISGVFPQSIRGGDENPAEKEILRNVKFGLARIRLNSKRNLALSRRNLLLSGAFNRVQDASSAKPRTASRPYKIGCQVVQLCYRLYVLLRISVAFVWNAIELIESVYVAFTVPLRIGFFYDPWNDRESKQTWTHVLTLFAAMDSGCFWIRLWLSRKELRAVVRKVLVLFCVRVAEYIPRESSVLHALRASIIGDELSFRSGRWSGSSARGDRVAPHDAVPLRRKGSNSRRSHQQQIPMSLKTFAAVLCCIPWELTVAFHNVNLLHVMCVMYFPHALWTIRSGFSTGVLDQFRSSKSVQLLSFCTVGTIGFLFVTGMYIAHLAASGYMFLAHCECGLDFSHCVDRPLPRAWVLKDHLEHGTTWRQYVRALYWGCKTVTTLGQGDIVPATNKETVYRIVVQFASGLWATAILTAYSFHFSHKDIDMNKNIATRHEQTIKLLASRKLSIQLQAKVRTYFHYMQRTRNGIEEELVLLNLPFHYRTQCNNYIRYRSFKRIRMFRDQQGAFLRTILSLLERDYFPPKEYVLHVGEREDMFVVARGELRILDAKLQTKGQLTKGNSYADYALFEDHFSKNNLLADTFCELWFLSRRSFHCALRKHYSKLMYASILSAGHSMPNSGTGGGDRTASSVFTGVWRRDSVSAMATHAKLRNVVSRSSVIANKMVQKLSRDASAYAKKIPAWRQRNSRFQSVWARIKCCLMIVLLVEVPHQIAYHRGFGLLNNSAQNTGALPFSIQQMLFVFTTLIEIFFYFDLYFRARCFSRLAVLENDSSDSQTRDSSLALIHEKSAIFRHFLENEASWIDLLEVAPLALIWDIIPKQSINEDAIFWVRFVRLLRLVRVRKLRSHLRSIMIEKGMALHRRLTVYIVLGICWISHLAACLFFISADRHGFRGGLPVNGVAVGSINDDLCLEHASVYDNCTWYIRDRSKFNIDAPILRSLHWSIVLLSTVGYGDILSFSTIECVIGAIWIFVGANICYFTGSAVSSVVSQINILSTIRRERVEKINLALMAMVNVSEKTKQTIRSYYQTKWKLNGSVVHDEDLLRYLPRTIQREVYTAMYLDDLRCCSLFVDYSDELLRSLALIVRCQIFLKNIIVVRDGHLASDFFVIQSGEAERLLSPFRSFAPQQAIKARPAHHTKLLNIYSGGRASTSRSRGSVSSQRSETITELQHGPASSLSRKSIRRSSSASFMFSKISSGRKILARLASNSSQIANASSRTRTSTEIRSGRHSSIELGDRLGKIIRLSSLAQVINMVGDNNSLKDPTPTAHIPVNILRKQDFFGEESITSHASHPELYHFSVRTLSTLQVAVIRRDQMLNLLSNRFPSQFAQLVARRKQHTKGTQTLLNTVQANMSNMSKIKKMLDISASLYVDSSKMNAETLGARICDPEKPFARWWHRTISLILIYNFYQIIFRIAFLPNPTDSTMLWLTVIDYVCDFLLYVDIGLKWNWLGYIQYDEKVVDQNAIRERYRENWLQWDCWSMVPLFYFGDHFYMTLSRLPRLLRSPQLLTLLNEIHTGIQEHFLRRSTKLSCVFDLVRFVLIFLSTAHYVGSGYYLIGRLQLESGITHQSWINNDFVLAQYPDHVAVHYMRAMYWCLSTFTVDCFGDVVAYNFAEVFYAGMTCIIGWVFIGQVIGQINLLMLALDKDTKEQQGLVEDFDQYARQRSLPEHLRQRAMDSMAYKSECFLELTVGSTFDTLPNALKTHLYAELYGSYLDQLPEFRLLSRAQLEAVANALYLEIYLHGDIIYESGRVGARMFIMKEGCAELYGPHSRAVYAVIRNGDVFGEFAFFLPGARRVASARAAKSCQVLQLDRRKWNALWPHHVRLSVEKLMLPLIKLRYQQTTRSYMNIAKNIYIKNDIGTIISPSRVGSIVMPASVRSLTSRRASLVLSANTKLGTLSLAAGSPSANSIVPPDQSTLNDNASSRRFSLPVRPIFRRSKSVTSTKSFNPFKSKTASPNQWIKKRQVSFPPVRRRSLEEVKEATTSSVRQPLQDKMELESISESTKDSSAEQFRGLSSVSESQWGRHFKRLQALQIFHADWARVENCLSGSNELNHYRRSSIGIFPSYYDTTRFGMAIPPTKTTAQVRRHTMHLNSRELHDMILQQHIIQKQDPNKLSLHNPAPPVVASLEKQQSGSSIDAGRGIRWPTMKQTAKVAPIPSPSYQSVVVLPSPLSPMFLENSTFRHYWDGIMLFVTLFYVIIIPFRASFLLQYYHAESHHLAIALSFAAEYLLTDLVCIADFILKCKYFAIQQDGETISDAASIAKQYWMAGSYFLDVVSMFPIELVLFLAFHANPHRITLLMDPRAAPSPMGKNTYTVWHILAIGRLNRFLRGVHLHALLNNVRRFIMYDLKFEWFQPSHFDIVCLAIDFAMGTHWIACFFYGVAFMTFEENEPSWLTEPGMLLFEGASSFAQVTAVPWNVAYVRSLHFSIGAITTVCYGDILPMNATETLATLIVIVLSVALFSMLSGGFFKFFEHQFGRRADYEEMVAQLGNYMVFHQFPARTWKQMQVYFALSWQESKGMQESQMLRGVTTGVRQDIALHVHANLMKHVKLFTLCDERFAKAIIAALTHELFVRNDVVIQRGDKGRSLYIIESGLVSVSIMRTVPNNSAPATEAAAVAGAETEVAPLVPVETPASIPPKRPSIAKRAVRRKTGMGGAITAANRVRLAVMAASTIAYQVQTCEISHNKRKIAATKQVEEKYVKGPYDYFGERSLLFATPQHATCVALCVCSLFVLSSTSFEDILEEFPAYRCLTMRAWVMNRQKGETSASGL